MKHAALFFLAFFWSVSLFAQDRIAVLPDTLHEISGIQWVGDKIFALNDGGNPEELYVLNAEGKLERTLFISGVKNVDWEDIAADDSGNLYIGDFGNNNNNRKNLKIIRIPNSELNRDTINNYGVINFTWERQTLFPPPQNELKYDCEAMFWDDDMLFLITKNRTEPYDGWMRLHILTDDPGNQTAKLIDSVNNGAFTSLFSSITGADMQDNKLYALSYTSISIMNRESGSRSFPDSITTIPLNGIQQFESVAVRDGIIWLANETSNFGKASLWTMKTTLSDKEPIPSKESFKVSITDQFVIIPKRPDRKIQEARMYDMKGRDIATLEETKNTWKAKIPGSGIWFISITDNLGVQSVVKILIP